MKDLLSGPLFKVCDIIQSDYDKPVVILEVKSRNGWYHYKARRLDKEQIRVNGPIAHYAQGSIAMFKVVGFDPAAATLFT